jgi:hypothetical protein
VRRGSERDAWHGGDGEQSRMRESREEGKKRPARFLTPRRSSSGSQQQKSGEAALARAARQEAAAAVLADPRARGGGFIGWPRGPWHAGPGRRAAGEAVPRLDSA